ncbi:Protein Wnt-8a [Trichoplax sp. H2]|nr:Protein Wnt-8a [Trichoplax sp. H2]|eukprot:RDD47241.1 Protein Wnt-8a [Trichoplax sp. H2]
MKRFYYVKNKANRENAVTYAFTSSIMMHAFMKECIGKRLECTCDTKPVGPKSNVTSWKALCVSHYTYSINLTKLILDKSFENSKDSRALMNHHNLRAGRIAVKRTLYNECTCHGTSGSCQFKTCWQRVASPLSIGNEIYKQYKDARLVQVVKDQLIRKKSTAKLDNAEKESKPVSAGKLVYLERSPNYCNATMPDGSILTTIGRNCTRQGESFKSCSQLCLKCGYKVKSVTVPKTVRCNCIYNLFLKNTVNCELCLKNVTHNWCIPSSFV